ncbi:MAG: 2Fe-2S iron-sulfur cluster-binding protein [Pyrinomonadaceae bacterium]
MTEPEIFDPYEKLIEITLLGRAVEVPENNSILRCFQFLNMEAVAESELCWNGECLDCQVWVKNGDKEKAVIACRSNAEAGMDIVRVSDKIQLS